MAAGSGCLPDSVPRRPRSGQRPGTRRAARPRRRWNLDDRCRGGRRPRYRAALPGQAGRLRLHRTLRSWLAPAQTLTAAPPAPYLPGLLAFVIWPAPPTEHWRQNRAGPLLWTVSRMAGTAAATVPCTVAGFSLALHGGGGFYWLAPAALLGTVGAVTTPEFCWSRSSADQADRPGLTWAGAAGSACGGVTQPWRPPCYRCRPVRLRRARTRAPGCAPWPGPAGRTSRHAPGR